MQGDDAQPVGGEVPVLGAIDVGTNAARLELARPTGTGGFDTLHYERAPIRPGEGVFETGVMAAPVADRLVTTMRRFAARCELHDARVRAVATSAMRTARNAEEVLRRIEAEAGIRLELISGLEEARLICLGACEGRPADERALVLDIGGGSTEVALALGGHATATWSMRLGAVRLTEMFGTAREVRKKEVRLLRAHVEQTLVEALGDPPGDALGPPPDVAFGCSGTIRAVVQFASEGPATEATAAELEDAIDRLVGMEVGERRERFGARRAEVIVAGAVILEVLVRRLGVRGVDAIDRGLRNGLLVDLSEREAAVPRELLLEEEAVRIGRRFHFEEHHGRHVARLALALFDALGPLHGLGPEARPLLEVAAWLHDVGKALSFDGHHKHGEYLIRHSEILGLVDHERGLAALVARFHRKSPPDPGHRALANLEPADLRIVRRLATLLRVADALDRSHRQRVAGLEASLVEDAVHLRLRSDDELQLERWDVAKERPLFEEVFGWALVVEEGGGAKTAGAGDER